MENPFEALTVMQSRLRDRAGEIGLELMQWAMTQPDPDDSDLNVVQCVFRVDTKKMMNFTEDHIAFREIEAQFAEEAIVEKEVEHRESMEEKLKAALAAMEEEEEED